MSFRKTGFCFLLLVLVPLTGCQTAPAFNIYGSYFPSWMLCVLVAILLAVVVRLVVKRLGVEEQMEPGIVTYPSLAAFFSFTLWLVFFN